MLPGYIMKIKNMSNNSFVVNLVLATGIIFSVQAEANPGANITSTLKSVEVVHNDKNVEITRTEDRNAVIPKAFMKTARGCPPFCIQPMQIAPGVETVGELELLGYLKHLSGFHAALFPVRSIFPGIRSIWTFRAASKLNRRQKP